MPVLNDGVTTSRAHYVDEFLTVGHPAYIDFFSTDTGNNVEGTTFVQAFPAATWTIPHNKGRSPIVYVFDNQNNLVLTDIESDDNQVVITFAEPFSGKAILL